MPEDAKAGEAVCMQQVHKGCGGEIVVCAGGGSVLLACDVCHASWALPMPFAMAAPPDDWEDYVCVQTLPKGDDA